MRQKVKEKHEGSEKQNGCPHYWVIEAAAGPTSQGVCKYCGEKKEFQNMMPNPADLKRKANPLNLPDLPKVDVDEGSKS